MQDDETQEKYDIKTTEPVVYAATSTNLALEKSTSAGIQQLSNGSVTVIHAPLLNEGTWLNEDVIVLLVKVLKDASEFERRAVVSQAVSKPCQAPHIMSLLKELN